MGYLSDNCNFAPLTEELHAALTGFDCQRELSIQEFFRNEAIPNAKELMGKSYCFYRPETMEAVAAFCVINTDISVDLIPKSTRNKLNRKIPYAKQRDHYPAVLIGQIAVFDGFAQYHLGNELMDSIKWWLKKRSKPDCRQIRGCRRCESRKGLAVLCEKPVLDRVQNRGGRANCKRD